MYGVSCGFKNVHAIIMYLPIYATTCNCLHAIVLLSCILSPPWDGTFDVLWNIKYHLYSTCSNGWMLSEGHVSRLYKQLRCEARRWRSFGGSGCPSAGRGRGVYAGGRVRVASCEGGGGGVVR